MGKIKFACKEKERKGDNYPGFVMSLHNNAIRVDWYNAGEGWNGDYHPEDPFDQNMLRYDVYASQDNIWDPMDDGSYCTRMPADTEPEILMQALEMLLKKYTEAYRKSEPMRKLGTEMSWISPEWFKKAISKDMIRDGIKRGIIRFVKDPNIDSGTVCKIGEYWFYFGGLTAEEETPEEYVRNVPEEDIVSEIYDTLESFRQDDGLRDEYLYYVTFLRENMKDAG